MSKTYQLTEDQLDFISFMKGVVSLHPEFNKRVDNCLLSASKDEVKASSSSEPEVTLCHSPQKTIEFLSLFSRDDRFKWYTHKWDMSKPFKIEDLKDVQTVNKRELQQMAYPKESGAAVNEATYNQVWNFINFDNPKNFPWKNNKLEPQTCGWRSIVDLSRSKPGVLVENLVLEDGHEFGDYIRMFKVTIEFRTDQGTDNTFSGLVRKRVKSQLPKDFRLTFSDNLSEIGRDLNVYCDVVGIVSGLNTICDWITKYKVRGSEVKVDLLRDDDYYVLEIMHCGSYFNNEAKLTNPSGDFETLRKRLFSVCDFTMKGDLKVDNKSKGSIIVKALDENTKITRKVMTPCGIEKSNKKTGGIKYQLKIYKRHQ